MLWSPVGMGGGEGLLCTCVTGAGGVYRSGAVWGSNGIWEGLWTPMWHQGAYGVCEGLWDTCGTGEAKKQL